MQALHLSDVLVASFQRLSSARDFLLAISILVSEDTSIVTIALTLSIYTYFSISFEKFFKRIDTSLNKLSCQSSKLKTKLTIRLE